MTWPVSFVKWKAPSRNDRILGLNSFFLDKFCPRFCTVFGLSQELRERISTSDSVSDDVQDAFGRQLLVLQNQRDSLLQQLEQQKKDGTSYVDILEEKNALEDSLR